jgi:enterochelin esterase-like enzyme
MKKARIRYVPLVSLIAAVVIVIGALQIDLVHQYIEIAWIQVSGTGWHLKGTCRTLRLWSPALRQSRSAVVYTPPGYGLSSQSNVRYPVLYLLHGSPDPGYGWSQYGRAQVDVDRLIVLDHFPPIIVVMPDGNGQGTFGDSEFIDAPAKQKNGKPGLKIGTYIVNDVVHWTDSHYRTIRGAQGRLIGGVSTGGYGAANLGLQYPNIFGTIFSFSGYYRADPTGWARPVWGYRPTKDQLFSQSPVDFLYDDKHKWGDSVVVLGDGLSDRASYRRDTDAFESKLKSSQITVIKFRYPGRHSWDLWRALLRSSLRTVRNRIPDNSIQNQ